MKTALKDTFTYDDLVAITLDVWFSASGETLVPEAAVECGAAYTGSVQITGPLYATVTVTCEAPLAIVIAAEMFRTDPDKLTSDDIGDVVGELANMVGGNVKALVPESSRLSLPSVVDGVEEKAIGDDARLITGVGFHCIGYGLRVSVWDTDRRQGPATDL